MPYPRLPLLLLVLMGSTLIRGNAFCVANEIDVTLCRPYEVTLLDKTVFCGSVKNSLSIFKSYLMVASQSQ